MEPESGRDSAPDRDLSSDAETFSVALGEQLRKVREAKRRTTEDVARAGRLLGLSWHRTTVGQVEQGKRNVTAAELFLLPLVYGRPLSDLLPPEDTAVWLTSQAAVHGAELRRVLVKGYNPNTAPADAASAQWHLLGMYDMLRDLAASAEKDIEQWPKNARGTYIAQPDEAEMKAAKRLDTTPQYVAYSARELWGRGLAEERDARLSERSDPPASPRALQAARGHITRVLLTELEPVVHEHESRRGEPSDPLRVEKTSTGVRFVRNFPKGEGDG